MDSNLIGAFGLCSLVTLVWILLVLQDIRFRIGGGGSVSTPTVSPLITASKAKPVQPYRILSQEPAAPPPRSTSVYSDGDYDNAPETDLQFSSSGRGWTGQSAMRNTSGIDISQFLG